jgi:hypothetical protein
MFGSYHIQPTTPDELPELGGFLREGFGEPPDVSHFSEEVLRWKYFEPCGIEFGPRSYVARAEGRMVGHVGIVPRTFVVRGDTAPADPVAALHFIDLLAAPGYPTAGLMLMKRGFQATAVQYALGGTADGQRIARTTGYELRLEFPSYRSILRPLYRLQASGMGRYIRFLGVGWDLARHLAHPCRPVRQTVTLQRVTTFGREIQSLVDEGLSPLTLATRSAELLNYYLSYPRESMSGWLIHNASRVVGFALLNVTTDRDVRHGKIVECFLACRDADLWHAVISALRKELKGQQAQIAWCYASTPWLDRACRRAGFFHDNRRQRFFLRGRLPSEFPYHLTLLEGDHAYI